jgi:hypothetical protein
MRLSASPSPYEAAVSRKFTGLSMAVRSVSWARSFATEKPNVSGMSPRGAHPKHNGETSRPVSPKGRFRSDRPPPFSVIALYLPFFDLRKQDPSLQ